MKKFQAILATTLVLSLLFAAASVWASPSGASVSDPQQTPGAKATAKAVEKATEQAVEQATEQASEQSNSSGNGDGNGNNQGVGKPEKNPGAKATEKAAERAGQGIEQGQAGGKKKVYHGVVEAVGGDSLTLKLKNSDESLPFAVPVAARIKVPTLANALLADVKVGANVLVQAIQTGANTWTALFVHVVPGKPEKVHRVGEVTDYMEDVSITIMAKNGEGYTFALTEYTKILPIGYDGDVEGQRVTIISRRDVTGGVPTAQAIVVHMPKASP